jgi:hypothetical protein
MQENRVKQSKAAACPDRRVYKTGERPIAGFEFTPMMRLSEKSSCANEISCCGMRTDFPLRSVWQCWQSRSSLTRYTQIFSTIAPTRSGTYTSLTNNSSPTRQEQRQAAAIWRALKEFDEPSESVATDYSLFAAAAADLGALTVAPDFLLPLTNTFTAFVGEARAEMDLTSARITALNDFVRTKKRASNQLAQAQAALTSLSSVADLRVGILLGRQVFAKIVRTKKLAASGEAHPGFALNSVTETTLRYNVGHGYYGFVAFTNSTHYEQTEITSERTATIYEGTYTYNRTGLNTARVVLNGTGLTNTVVLEYRSPTNGAFTDRTTSAGRVQSRRGTFTLN